MSTNHVVYIHTYVLTCRIRVPVFGTVRNRVVTWGTFIRSPSTRCRVVHNSYKQELTANTIKCNVISRMFVFIVHYIADKTFLRENYPCRYSLFNCQIKNDEMNLRFVTFLFHESCQTCHGFENAFISTTIIRLLPS